MPYNNYPFMSVDINYYQELVREADHYKEILHENQQLKMQLDILMNENHLLKQGIQDSIPMEKIKQR